MKTIRNGTLTALKLFGFYWPIDWEGTVDMGMTFPQADLFAFGSDNAVVTDP